MPTLSGLQMNTWTDSLALKLNSNFFELYSKCFELHNYAKTWSSWTLSVLTYFFHSYCADNDILGWGSMAWWTHFLRCSLSGVNQTPSLIARPAQSMTSCIHLLHGRPHRFCMPTYCRSHCDVVFLRQSSARNRNVSFFWPSYSAVTQPQTGMQFYRKKGVALIRGGSRICQTGRTMASADASLQRGHARHSYHPIILLFRLKFGAENWHIVLLDPALGDVHSNLGFLRLFVSELKARIIYSTRTCVGDRRTVGHIRHVIRPIKTNATTTSPDEFTCTSDPLCTMAYRYQSHANQIPRRYLTQIPNKICGKCEN